MTVNKKVPDLRLFRDSSLDLRTASQRFLISLRASNGYSPRYLEALEFSLALLSGYSEEQGWPGIAQLTTSQP